MFEPELQLIPEPDGEFSLLATTLVPGTRFTAGKVVKKAPADVKVGAHVVPIRLELKYKPKGNLGEPYKVTHRAFNLKIVEGSLLTAYVTLADGQVLGTADAFISLSKGGNLKAATFSLTAANAHKVQLTPQFCQNVVVAATGNAGSFTGPEQQLRFLGVVDPNRATLHKIAIGNLMTQAGFQINLGQISSGPAVKVAACRDSVFNNAS